MAVYEKGNRTKQRLITAMYDKLKTHEAPQITVREFTKEIGLSPSALYRHFESLEYLIILGVIRFYIGYMMEYGQLMDYNKNPLESYIKGWKLFNKYAFERPDLYYRLLLGQYNRSFSDALDEYLELFPLTGLESDSAYFYTLLFTNDFRERDLLMLKRAVNCGLLSFDDAVYYSKSNTLIVKGMLENYIGCDLAARRQGEIECNQLLLRNLEKVLRN